MRAKIYGRRRQLCRIRSSIHFDSSHLIAIFLLLANLHVSFVGAAGVGRLRQESKEEVMYTSLQSRKTDDSNNETPKSERISDASFGQLGGDASSEQENVDPTRRTQILDVQPFEINLVIVLSYLDEATADILAGGDPSDPIVHRFCSAVNRQSGSNQVRKSAEEDNLTIFTRPDYSFPETGCEVIGTNFAYTAGGPPNFGPGYVALEILLSQLVLVSPLTDGDTAAVGDVSYEQVYNHVSKGFIGGTGGKAKFRKILKSENGATGQTITQFESIVDVDVIGELNDPVPRPTVSPTAVPIPTMSPTARPTLEPMKDSTQAPTRPPSKAPTKKPVLTAAPTSISAGGNPGVGSPSASQPKTERPTEGPTTKAPGGNANVQQPESTSEGGDNSIVPTAAIAAAAGAGLGILVVGLLSLYRCHAEGSERKRDQDLPVATAVPAEVVKTRTRGWSTVPSSLPRPPSPPPPKPQAPESHLLGARRPPPVPAVVTDADGRSLAESTIGSRTAGRKVWAPPPPPVQFLQATWKPGDGVRAKASSSAFSVAAASQISSLESGTVGAGGQTVGGFSLEAAIRDDDTEDEDEKGAIQAGVSSADSDDGVAENDNSNSDTQAAEKEELPPAGATAIAGGAFASEVGGELENEAVAVVIPSDLCMDDVSSTPDTPNDSLDGTASLFGASSTNSAVEMPSRSEIGSREHGGQSATAAEVAAITKVKDDDKALPLPPPDQTPRASGNRVNLKAHISDDDCVTPVHGDDDDVNIFLPPSLAPEGDDRVVAGDARPGAVSPDSHSVHSEKSWASAFAEGTGAILSASLGVQSSDGSVASSVDDVLPPPPPPRDKSPVPPVLLVSKRSSPGSAEKRGFPSDFPDTPLADPPFSDGSAGSGFDGRDVSRVLDKSLAEVAEVTRENAVVPKDSKDGMRVESKDDCANHKMRSVQRARQKTATPDRSQSSTSPCSSSSSSLQRLRPEHHSSGGSSLHLPRAAPATPSPPPPSLVSKSPLVSSAVAPPPQLGGVYQTPERVQDPTVGSIASHSTPKSELISHHFASRSRPMDELAVGSDAAVSSLGRTSNKPEIDLRAIAQVAVAAAADGGSPSDTRATTASLRTNNASSSPCSHRSGEVRESPRSPRGQALGLVSTNKSQVSPTPLTPASKSSRELGDNKSAGSNSSFLSGDNPNPWLLDALTGTLGPRGQSADMESLSERSARSSSSLRSNRSNRSKSSTAVGSHRSSRSKRSSKYGQNSKILSSGSVGSRSSRISHQSHYSSASRSIASDLQRLEAQLSMLGPGEEEELSSTLGSTPNSSSMSSVPSPSLSSSKHNPSSETTSFITGRSQMNVTAPPGRLGVILANRSEGQGTVVSALRTSSVLVGKVLPGDRLVAIDGQDVSELHVGEVTAIMGKKAHSDRILTVMTPSKGGVGSLPASPTGRERGSRSISASPITPGSSAVNA